jgi:formylglycine-generating enzyme required for sulfatase activity
MTGVRTVLLLIIVAMAVALPPSPRQQPLQFAFVATPSGLQVMRHEVTISQWRHCVSDSGCTFMPKSGPGARNDAYPVTGIGALDAREFVVWASRQTGRALRLPTLDEWYHFSEVPAYQPGKIFTDPRLAWAATYGSEGKVDSTLQQPGSFGQTATGIADVKGNVWEWTSSCVVNIDFPTRCPAYFAAGEHQAKIPVFVRDPSTGGCATGNPPAHIGLRLVWSDD